MSEGRSKKGPSELPEDGKPKKRRKPDRERQEDEDRPRKKRAKKNSSLPIVLAVVGVFAVLGIALGAYLIISAVGKRNQEVRQNNDLANPQNIQKPSPESDASYSNVDTWQRYENISVKVTSPKIAKVPAILGDNTVMSSNPLLSFEVHILNHDQNKNLEYKSWQWNRELNKASVFVSDDLGFNYGLTRVLDDSKIVDSIQAASIAPGEQAKDLIVLDIPKSGAKFLLLRVQGGALGVVKDFKCRLAVKDIPKS